jgi:hypothetical protein
MVSPKNILVSISIADCFNISSSIFTIFSLKNKISVDPPNLKYPFSSPFLTEVLGLYVWTIEPTEVAPTSTYRTLPKFTESKTTYSRLLLQKIL